MPANQPISPAGGLTLSTAVPVLASRQAPQPQQSSSSAPASPQASSGIFSPSSSLFASKPVSAPPAPQPTSSQASNAPQFSTTYGGAPIAPGLHIVGAPTTSAGEYYATFNALNRAVGGGGAGGSGSRGGGGGQPNQGAGIAQQLTQANAANQPTSVITAGGNTYLVPGLKTVGTNQYTFNGVPVTYSVNPSGGLQLSAAGSEPILPTHPSIAKPTVVQAPSYANQNQLSAFAAQNGLYNANGSVISVKPGEVLLVLPQNFPNPQSGALTQQQAEDYGRAVVQYIKQSQASGQLGYQESVAQPYGSEYLQPNWFSGIKDATLRQQLGALGVNALSLTNPAFASGVQLSPSGESLNQKLSLLNSDLQTAEGVSPARISQQQSSQSQYPLLNTAISSYLNLLNAAQNFYGRNINPIFKAGSSPYVPSELNNFANTVALPFLGSIAQTPLGIIEAPQIFYNLATNPLGTGEAAYQYATQNPAAFAGSLYGGLLTGRLLGEVSPRVRLTSGQGIDVGAVTFKVGENEIPLAGIVRTPSGIRGSIGTPSLTDLLENPQLTVSGEPVSLYPATTSFGAKTTLTGGSANLLTTPLGRAILVKSLRNAQEGMPVEATYALSGLDVAQKLSNAKLPTPNEFFIELKGLPTEENRALTDVVKQAAEEGIIQKVYGSSSFHLQAPEAFRLGADIDIGTLTSEQAAKLAESVTQKLNNVAGFDKYSINPAEPNLVTDATGRHVTDIHAIGEPSSSGVTGKETPLGLRQTEPVNIEGVPTQAGSQTLKEKFGSALSVRVINPADVIKAPEDWQSYLNNYLDGKARTTFAPGDWRIKDVVDSYTTAKILNSYNLNPISRSAVDGSLENFKQAATTKFGLTAGDFATGKADITSLIKGNPESELNNNAGFLFQSAGATAITAQAINPALLVPSPTSSVVYDPALLASSPSLVSSPQASSLINGIPSNIYLAQQALASEVSQSYQNAIRNLYLSQLPSSIKQSILSTAPSLVSSTLPTSASPNASVASPLFASSLSPSATSSASPVSPYVSSPYSRPLSSYSVSPSYSPSPSSSSYSPYYYLQLASNPAFLSALAAQARGKRALQIIEPTPSYSARYAPSVAASLLNLQGSNIDINPSSPSFGLQLRPFPSQLSPAARRRIALAENPKEAFA